MLSFYCTFKPRYVEVNKPQPQQQDNGALSRHLSSRTCVHVMAAPLLEQNVGSGAGSVVGSSGGSGAGRGAVAGATVLREVQAGGRAGSIVGVQQYKQAYGQQNRQAALQAVVGAGRRQCRQFVGEQAAVQVGSNAGSNAGSGSAGSNAGSSSGGRQVGSSAGSSSAGRLPPAGDKQFHSHFSTFQLGKRVPSRWGMAGTSTPQSPSTIAQAPGWVGKEVQGVWGADGVEWVWSWSFVTLSKSWEEWKRERGIKAIQKTLPKGRNIFFMWKKKKKKLDRETFL